MPGHKPRTVFVKHRTKIKRPNSILGLACDEVEEIFVNALRQKKLHVMKNPEGENFFVVKSVTRDGKENSTLSTQTGKPAALNPKTGELFLVKVKENNEVTLLHIGFFSGKWKKLLPEFQKITEQFEK